MDYWGKKETLGVFIMTILVIIMIAPSLKTKTEITTKLVDELYDPTFNEAAWFMLNDTTDKNKYVDGEYVCANFALDTIKNAEKLGIRCIYVIVYNLSYKESNHAIVAFDTTDKGKIYFEPQTDNIVNPRYMDIWE